MLITTAVASAQVAVDSFDPGADNSVNAVVVQPDGKIPTFDEILTDWRDWLGARLLGRSPRPHGSHVPAQGPAHARGTVSDPAE